MKNMIETNEASHFCLRHQCGYGRSTFLPNGYIVSSVGDFVYEGKRREIGYNRFYETMVFLWNGQFCKDADCFNKAIHAEEGSIKFQEIALKGSLTQKECISNHNNLVEKWSSRYNDFERLSNGKDMLICDEGIVYNMEHIIYQDGKVSLLKE